MTTALGPVSAEGRERLIGHYSGAVVPWLDAVPELLATAAGRWHLELHGYHDAGHASVLATATIADGQVMVKAWFDPDRYWRETHALKRWHGGPVPRLLHAADDLHVATITLVGNRPGGHPRPPDEQERVATALHSLHADPFSSREDIPALATYLAEEIFPRINRRKRRIHNALTAEWIKAGWAALPNPTGEIQAPAVLLHADLYKENVPFDEAGQPVFIDPLPMIGDPAFDWAFWVVYYDLTRDPLSRLRLAVTHSGIPADVLRPWCLMLGLDGLLYYDETGDTRMKRMGEVLTALTRDAM